MGLASEREMQLREEYGEARAAAEDYLERAERVGEPDRRLDALRAIEARLRMLDVQAREQTHLLAEILDQLTP